VNKDGWGLLPVTVMENLLRGQNSQILVIIKVPVAGGCGCGGDIIVVLPSGQVTATPQAMFVFMFVSCSFLKSDFLCAKEFCIIGTKLVAAPTNSIDVITTTIMTPLIVWFTIYSTFSTFYDYICSMLIVTLCYLWLKQ
jgi:hypothetical protein